MKHKQQIFNPPRMKQANILHEAKIQEKRNKIENLTKHADQLKAIGQHERSKFYHKEIARQEDELKNLIMSPLSLEIPRNVFYG